MKRTELKKYLLAAVVTLMATPGLAAAQMTGGGMMAGSPAAAEMHGQHEMTPQTRTGGMMGQGMQVPGDCMMQGGMMGSGAMGPMMHGGAMGNDGMASMMAPMMDGMMSGGTRGSLMMADGMMAGRFDLGRMGRALSLTDEQSNKLRTNLRPFQKEAILSRAALKVAELELADLLAADKVDFAMVETKLKEIEGIRTKARLSQLKATLAVRGILSKEQLDKLQGEDGCAAATQPQMQKDETRRTGPGHQHHQ